MRRGYGELNGYSISVIMQEMVRQAINIIQKHRFVFESSEKSVEYKPNVIDFVTNADQEAQRMYVRHIRECFPGFGIVAEEDGLAMPCAITGENLWFTVDPLDGTKAYVRRQSHGVGTMISLVRDGEIVAAYVGDALTREIYGYCPDSEDVLRISDLGHSSKLAIDPNAAFKEQYVSLREDPRQYGQGARGYADLGKGLDVGGGSIGIWLARLWKGEVGMAILLPGRETPWDRLPIYGISEKLGFRHLLIDPRTGRLSRWQTAATPDTETREEELLIVHESRLADALRLYETEPMR